MAPRKPLKVATQPEAKALDGACATDVGCQIQDLFRLLGKAHMLDIIYVTMFEGDGRPRRFVDIQKLLHMSPNTLSERLKELVDAGMLTRTAYNEIPPRVDYQATDKARALLPVFRALKEWASQNNLQPLPTTPTPAMAKGAG